jgi:hypothetical protein
MANPLTHLHDSLSAELHNGDDEQCLEPAKDIRLLLTAHPSPRPSNRLTRTEAMTQLTP